MCVIVAVFFGNEFATASAHIVTECHLIRSHCTRINEQMHIKEFMYFEKI